MQFYIDNLAGKGLLGAPGYLSGGTGIDYMASPMVIRDKMYCPLWVPGRSYYYNVEDLWHWFIATSSG